MLWDPRVWVPLYSWKIISEPKPHRWMEERRDFTHKCLQLSWWAFWCIFAGGQKLFAQHQHNFLSSRSSMDKYHLAQKNPKPTLLLITNTFPYGQDIVIQFLFWGPECKAWIHSYDEHNPELKHVLSDWTRKDLLRRAHTIWGNSLSARQGVRSQKNWLLPSGLSLKCFYHSGQMSDISTLLFTSTARCGYKKV